MDAETLGREIYVACYVNAGTDPVTPDNRNHFLNEWQQASESAKNVYRGRATHLMSCLELLAGGE